MSDIPQKITVFSFPAEQVAKILGDVLRDNGEKVPDLPNLRWIYGTRSGEFIELWWGPDD